MTVWTPLPPLIGITPGDHLVDRDVVRLVEGAVDGGLEMIVVREAHLDQRQLVDLARRLAPLVGDGLILHAKNPAALEVAEAARWGLHLPAGADIAEARRQVKGRLGVSCHSALEIAAARQSGADYVTFSPIYKPTSKAKDLRRPAGTRMLGEICRSADIQVVALGGINPRRARACRKAGAAAVAVISDLFGPEATPEACRESARALIAAMTG